MSGLKIIAVMLTCITIGSHFGRLNFAFDTSSHFKVHYAVLFVLFGIIFVLAKQPKWLAFSLVGVIINLMSIVPWYVADRQWSPADASNSIKILVSNVHQRNRNYERLLQLVDEEQPDILGLIEVDSQWLENLASIRNDYKFKFEYAKENLLGLALFSKLPVSEPKIILFGESATPAIVATIAEGEETFEFILAHPMAPFNAERALRRNSQLQQMAQYVRASGKIVVLAGDLNTTMWSPYYSEFEHESGLTNARAGYGIGATWSPIPALGIPIDHILVTPPAQVGDFQVHEGIGSDHLAISADVRILPRTSDRLVRSTEDR